MFYVSKVSPYFFMLAMLDLFASLLYKGFDIRLSWTIGVFGFIAHTIMSAMYQIVPNSQGKALRFLELSYLVFLLSVISSALFYLNLTLYASLLYALTSTLFVIHILASVRNYQPVTVKFLVLGSAYLLIGSYLLLAYELGLVSLPLALHSITLGFMLNVVVGVELAWIPMLSMEQLSIRHAKRLFYFAIAYLPPFLLSFYLLDYKLVAYLSVLPFAFIAYFLWLIYSLFANRRMPREIPLAVKYFFLALSFLPFGVLMGSVMSSMNLASHLASIHADILLYGFTATTIMGGLFHLLPRIIYGMVVQDWRQTQTATPALQASISDLVDEQGVKRLLPFVALSVFFMVFLDGLGLAYLSFIPYLVVWVFFIRYVFIKGIFIKCKGG